MREVSRVLGMPKSTVCDAVRMARVAGMDWPLVQTLTDDQLEARVYPAPVRSSAQHADLDYAHIHREIKRKGVTLQLLWEEYAAGNPLAYRYTAFCVKYRAWTQSLKRSMRQTHIAGDKLFVDYAGQTLPVIDPSTGEIRRAQIFVAVLGASNYTYARATATQTAVDWVGSIIDAMEFIGGVPCLIVPDQPRALFAHPDRYEPKPGPLVEELADHYAVAVMPARPAHPRDKPKVEVAVQIVERWILARLRNRRFFSLVEVNAAIWELLVELNMRPFKKLPGCRREAFETLDQPVLRPLPPQRMQLARLKRARVNIDYHVEFDHHYYSVPHRLVGTEVDVRATDLTVEVLAGGKRVAAHVYSALKGRHTTLSEHMPASHRAHREWTPAKLIAWGERIGVATAAVVRWQMDNRPHPEQGYRACLGLQRLAREYTPQRLEAACARALSIKSLTYRSVSSILKSGLDRQQPPAKPVQTTLALHDNVRGADYYH